MECVGRFSEFGSITIWLDLADINGSADRRTELAVRRPGSRFEEELRFPFTPSG